MANYKTADGKLAIWVGAGENPAAYGTGLVPCTDAEAAAIMAARTSSVPASISDRQFFQQLAVKGNITQDEALAAVATGTIPAAMAALVGQLPADSQFAAKMLLCGATIFERAHPLTATLGQMYGMDAAALDAFWQQAALL
jgi:hypothetical protein